MFVKRIKAVDFGVGPSFFHGPEALGSWRLDRRSPFEKLRVLDPAPNARVVRQIRAKVTALFPQLAGLDITGAWGAYIDSTPDAVPVISPVDGKAGLFVAAGCSGHGFGLGPGIGHLAADLVAGDAPCVDPKPFRLMRFRDRSKVEVGSI